MDAALRMKQNLQSIIADAEELLKATATQTGERVEKTRARVEASLRDARARLAEAGAEAAYSARQAARTVHENTGPGVNGDIKRRGDDRFRSRRSHGVRVTGGDDGDRPRRDGFDGDDRPFFDR